MCVASIIILCYRRRRRRRCTLLLLTRYTVYVYDIMTYETTEGDDFRLRARMILLYYNIIYYARVYSAQTEAERGTRTEISLL